MSSIHVDVFGGRKIAIRGVGLSFYQDGYPISLSVKKLMDEGVEVSLLHVADECLKNGWSPQTTLKKLREDFVDGGYILDEEQLSKFVFSSYEDQRQMIFDYLFSSTTNAKDWFKNKIA